MYVLTCTCSYDLPSQVFDGSVGSVGLLGEPALEASIHMDMRQESTSFAP